MKFGTVIRSSLSEPVDCKTTGPLVQPHWLTFINCILNHPPHIQRPLMFISNRGEVAKTTNVCLHPGGSLQARGDPGGQKEFTDVLYRRWPFLAFWGHFWPFYPLWCFWPFLGGIFFDHFFGIFGLFLVNFQNFHLYVATFLQFLLIVGNL